MASANVRAGTLQSRLVVERPISTIDDMGSELITWQLVATVWAKIAPIAPFRGREELVNNIILAQLDTRITIRWSPRVDGMTAKWRLRFATRSNPVIFNIAAPPAQINMGQRVLEIICKSGANDG